MRLCGIAERTSLTTCVRGHTNPNTQCVDGAALPGWKMVLGKGVFGAGPDVCSHVQPNTAAVKLETETSVWENRNFNEKVNLLCY